MHTVRHPETDTSVVFVHGILSSGESCWTSKLTRAYWPELLSRDPNLQGVGIYDFSYRADFFNANFSPLDAANYLNEELHAEKLWKSKRLVFVCHSLGGIVVRQLLVNEKTNIVSRHHTQKIGLFLIASPSLGSKYANIVTSLLAVVGIRNQEATSLKSGNDNTWLTTLDQHFMNILDRRELPIYGKELIEDETIDGIKRLSNEVIVAYYSGKRYFGDYYKVPDSNHITIAKPATEKADQHQSLIRFIQENILPQRRDVGPATIEPREAQQALHLLHELETAIDKHIQMFWSFKGIQRALEEVFSYSTCKEAARIPSKEKHLSELWEAASSQVAAHNIEISQMCSLKGHAWADFPMWCQSENRELLIRVKDKVERVLNLGEVTNPNHSLGSFLGMTSVPRKKRKFGIFLPSFQGGGPLSPQHDGEEDDALTGPFQGPTYAVADIWASWAVASLLAQVEAPKRVTWYPRPHRSRDLEECSHHFFIGGKSNSMSMDTISRCGCKFRMDCRKDSAAWLIEDTETKEIYDVPNPWKDRAGYEVLNKDYGLIGKFTSGQKVQFFISGLGSKATEALGMYLMEHWDELSSNYGSNDFVALFKCTRTATELLGGQTLFKQRFS